jgi:hypothetical protein
LHVSDQASVPLSNILIKIYKYNLATNSYSLINSLLTDFNGEAIADLVASKTYRFDLYQSGTLEASYTSKILSTTTDLYFKITTGGNNALKNYLDLLTIRGVIDHSSTTHLIEGNWSDPSGYASQICLKITEVNASNQTTIVMNCTTNISQLSMNHTLTSYTNKTYIAILEAQSSDDGLWYIIDTEEFTYQTTYGTYYGEEGLLYAWLFIGTVTVLGIVINPAIGLYTMAFMIVVSKIMGILAMGWTAIVGFAIGAVILGRLIKT